MSLGWELRAAPNSAAAIGARLDRISPWGLLAVCGLRTVLAALSHAATAGLLALWGVADPWEAAAPWMPVWGTAVDLGSLTLLALLLRREGLRIRDLLWAVPPSRGDLLRGLGVLLVLGLLGFAGGSVAGLLVLGTATPPPPFAPLPLWGGLYATLVWPVIWGFTEEATYNGYAAPRLEARWGRAAVSLAVLGWALQHVALPLHLDPAFAAWRLLSSLPVAVGAVAIYLHTRRLLPLVVAHVLVDMASGALTLLPAG